MNACLYVNEMLETNEEPTIKHGWAMIFASPEAAALDHDPTATLVAEWEKDLDGVDMPLSHWSGAIKGDFVVRGWWDWDNYNELYIDGYLIDSWLNSRLEHEGVLA